MLTDALRYRIRERNTIIVALILVSSCVLSSIHSIAHIQRAIQIRNVTAVGTSLAEKDGTQAYIREQSRSLVLITQNITPANATDFFTPVLPMIAPWYRKSFLEMQKHNGRIVMDRNVVISFAPKAESIGKEKDKMIYSLGGVLTIRDADTKMHILTEERIYDVVWTFVGRVPMVVEFSYRRI